jgi:hypothetical protein
MKARLLKIGVTFFLVAVVVMAGVLASHPGKSQAAGGTVYNVTLQSPSWTQNFTSIQNGAPVPEPAKNAGTTFQMVIGTKAAKDGSLPVTILAKSYKSAPNRFPMVGGGGYADAVLVMKKDAVGKYYPKGGAPVDVSVVFGAKGAKTTIGGAAGPAGSMIIPLTTDDQITLESTKKMVMDTLIPYTFTTGTATIVVQGTKTRLEGKGFPKDDPSKYLPNPLTGSPLDLNAGTGTLVGVGAETGQKNKAFGLVDCLNATVFQMTITKK